MMNCYLKLENVSIDIPILDASKSFRHTIATSLGGQFSRNRGKQVQVHALKDINFSLESGDRLGLIGHNGAGKTTLLRLLAGIYKPTQGKYIHKGRVVPLFNMNIGIDMDDTGYENVQTIGMFLGMPPDEIRQKTDEIISFSELGDYIHLPVRTYSAGMLTRLSFSIATSVEADILLMDEGIGAGDASFREKATERVKKFYDNSKIMVMASHSNELLRSFCNEALVLHKGEIIGFGCVDDMLDLYEKSLAREREEAVI